MSLPSSFVPFNSENEKGLPSSFVPFNQQEGGLKSAARTALQIPLGIAKRSPISYGADLFKLASEGASREILADLAENDPLLNKEIAEEARQKSMEYIPTQALAEKVTEKLTGLPLEAKNDFQSSVRMGSTAAAFRPGGIVPKGTAAIVAPATKEALKAGGIPEAIAEPIGYVASGLTPTPTKNIQLKSSGMTTRNFENVKKPIKVTPNRLNKINETVEKDFKAISDKLFSENKTYRSMKEDSLFKEKIGDLFENVKELADDIPGTISTAKLRSAFRKRYNSRESKGISPNEFEKAFRKQVEAISNDFPDVIEKKFMGKKVRSYDPHSSINATELVDQFRKNNSSLKDLFEPGKSSAFNKAKKEALLEYNRAIEDIIKKEYPDSEFKNLFEFTNKRWQEINDIEQIDEFLGHIFNEKIDFGKARQIFQKNKEYVARPFKRILGEEKFQDFKDLMEDLMTLENPLKNIKKAEAAGFGDLAKNAAAWLIHPKLAGGKIAFEHGKHLVQMLLDKPKYIVTWKTALDALKKGNFAEAEKGFQQLEKGIKGPQTSPK